MACAEMTGFHPERYVLAARKPKDNASPTGACQCEIGNPKANPAIDNPAEMTGNAKSDRIISSHFFMKNPDLELLVAIFLDGIEDKSADKSQ